MPAPMVTIRYSREFPHSAQACYAWLTDYDDQDPARAGAVVQRRRVLERGDDRVILEVENVLLGRAIIGRTEVRLHPDELRYEARSLEGDGGAILYRYRLTPIGADRTRLDVEYGTRVRRWSRRAQLVLLRPLIRRQLHGMWNGFARAMAADLKSS